LETEREHGAQPGKQEGRVEASPLANGAEGAAADCPEEAAAVDSVSLPEEAATATTNHQPYRSHPT